jgi:predicted Zn-dependent peptidase
MRRKLSPVVLCFAFAGLPLFSWGAVEDLSSRVKEVKLPNGLTCLLVERHLSPTASFHIFFPVGSVDDEPGKTGLAHLFEHMMFKGTKTVGVKDSAAEAKILEEMDRVMKEIIQEESRSPQADASRLAALRKEFEGLTREHEKLVVPGEYWTIYERAGAEGMNAGTSADFTEYTVSLPSNKIELWMAMESDRLQNAVVREFYKERSVVMEERRLRVDTSPSGKLWEVFLRAAFGSHPYGEPVVGRMEDVEHLTRPDAIRFFREHYLLSRGVISIVGDFSTASMERMLRKYFGSLRGPEDAKPASLRPAIPAPHIDREVRVVVPFDAEPEILIGYLEPPLGSVDEPVLEALAEILSLGRTSRLYRSLVESKQIALEAVVSTGEPGQREPNLFTFDAVPRAPHTAEDCLQAIDEEIKKIQANPPSPWELEKVKNNMEADLLRSLASNSGLSWRLGYCQALLGDWRYIVEFLEKLRRVTPKDVSRAARTYLDPRHRVIAVRVRKGEK